MRQKKEFYGVILRGASEKRYLSRRGLHALCREMANITDAEWNVPKKDGTSLYANRIDFAKLDLRIAGLVQPYCGKRGCFCLTDLGREAVEWPASELLSFVNEKIIGSRHEKGNKGMDVKSYIHF